MPLTSHQRIALDGLKFCFGALVVLVVVWLLASCSRRSDVGDEKNNPAPSSSLTLEQAKAQGAAWAIGNPDRTWTNPAATSSMVPYLDSHSVVLLERPTGEIRIHDIVVVNEGPGRENVIHQVMRIDGGAVYIEGKNNQWPDGWLPKTAISWRACGVLYSKG